MKILNISQQGQKDRENALNQICILVSLDSPYIVQYKQSFVDSEGRTLIIIMELATGGDLNSLLQQRDVEEAVIWRVVTQITLGVKILHDNYIFHRDLKLANEGKQQEEPITKLVIQISVKQPMEPMLKNKQKHHVWQIFSS